jgi:hypothetical protein
MLFSSFPSLFQNKKTLLSVSNSEVTVENFCKLSEACRPDRIKLRIAQVGEGEGELDSSEGGLEDLHRIQNGKT